MKKYSKQLRYDIIRVYTHHKLQPRHSSSTPVKTDAGDAVAIANSAIVTPLGHSAIEEIEHENTF